MSDKIPNMELISPKAALSVIWNAAKHLAGSFKPHE